MRLVKECGVGVAGLVFFQLKRWTSQGRADGNERSERSEGEISSTTLFWWIRLFVDERFTASCRSRSYNFHPHSPWLDKRHERSDKRHSIPQHDSLLDQANRFMIRDSITILESPDGHGRESGGMLCREALFLFRDLSGSCN